MKDDMQKRLDSARLLVEKRLCEFFTQDLPQKRLFEAMRYSLLSGGKRIRPILAIEFCHACGGRAEDALDFACALEMIHSYSLIHDDLPCMDNSQMRRGRKTNHMVFGEYTAVLAGDALQAAAFETVLRAPLPANLRLEAAQILAEAAGERGICGGQILDLDGESKHLDLAEIETLHRLKTAALIEAAAVMGCIAAGAAENLQKAAASAARALGLAFQLQDDLLDAEGDEKSLGKPVGKDLKKSTFLRQLGTARCRALVREQSQLAKDTLTAHFENPDFLIWLIDQLAQRRA